MKPFQRKRYLNKLINAMGTSDVKIITGARRSGKSKLLESFKSYVIESIQNANIVYINFSRPDFYKLMEYRSLYDYVNSAYKDGVDNFVLVDDIQMCYKFERAINNLQALEKFDIYITGSSAFLSNRKLAKLFIGKTFEIKVYPLSFIEYVEYTIWLLRDLYSF